MDIPNCKGFLFFRGILFRGDPCGTRHNTGFARSSSTKGISGKEKNRAYAPSAKRSTRSFSLGRKAAGKRAVAAAAISSTQASEYSGA